MIATTRARFGCCGSPATPEALKDHKCKNLERGGNSAGKSAARAAARRQVEVAGSNPARPALLSRPGRAAEDALAAQLGAITYGAWLRLAMTMGWMREDCVREWPWGLLLEPPRRFRADIAYPCKGVLVEVEGLAHSLKRQQRIDVLRDQLAQQAGYRIVRVLPEQVASGDALAVVRAAVNAPTVALGSVR